MTDALHRCANCGIADEGAYVHGVHVGIGNPCLRAALAKLRECRPIIQMRADGLLVAIQVMQEPDISAITSQYEHEANKIRALLASLPGEG